MKLNINQMLNFTTNTSFKFSNLKKSSKMWLREHVTDEYVKKAKHVKIKKKSYV